jgi:hypothetical protein
MNTEKDHDIRHADKKGLATLLDFAVKADSEEEQEREGEEKSHARRKEKKQLESEEEY